VTLASALLPGTGHLIIGKRRIALVYLVPTLLLALVVGLWAMRQGMYGVAAALVTPGVLTALFAANILFAGWRVSAAVEATGRTHPGRIAVAASAIVLLLTVGIPHLIVGNTILATEAFLDETFAGIDELPPDEPIAELEETPVPEFTEPPLPTEPPPGVTPAPATPAPSPTPVIPPYPKDGGNGTLPRFGAAVPWKRADPAQPWGNDGRFDLLLIGSDAGAGRWSRRNDVMLLVEVDVQSGRVAMVGLPRNLQNAPYPPGPARDSVACGCQDGLLNEMYVEATVRNPGLWPGRGSVKGIGAVRSVVSTLTGRPIDAVLIVDLIGVVRVVDAMGGIDIDVPEAVEDDEYPQPGQGKEHIRIKAGKQHMDGRTALAYARSRHQDSDYGRMQRQQTLLLAIRRQLGPEQILNAPALFAATKGTAWTDLPREAIPALVELFGTTQGQDVEQLRIVPSRYPSFMTAAWVNQVRRDVANLLPGIPRPRDIAVPRPVATPRPTPRPTPKPAKTPKPTTRPTAPPTEEPTEEPPPEPTPTP
jgi:LCP family protein required for cell wall assembly